MAAYLIVRMNVTDPVQIKAYQAATPAIVQKYRGKFIVRGGASATLEGPSETRRIVVIEFPERADAEAYYHSPEYTAARALREGSAVVEFVVVDGVAP